LVIGCSLDLSCRIARLPLLRRLDLGETRHIRIAQDQADVRMRYQASPRIYHISLAMCANLNLRDDIPDELEIDFRDANSGIPPGTGKRQYHVRLRFASEVDRSVINLVFYSLGELGLFRQIEIAADNIHGKARDSQLLLATRIHLSKLSNRGNLTQQA